MSTINTSYAAMQYTMNATQQSNKQTKQQGSSKVAQSSQTEAAGQKTLSKDAQAVQNGDHSRKAMAYGIFPSP